jgi:transcriptional regulator with XRE-family HTH domain
VAGLGARLKELRKGRGLTQDAVARELGLARASIAQWEGDRHLPSFENVTRLDQLYGAMGALVARSEELRSGGEGAPLVRNRTLNEVFDGVADALVKALRTDGPVIGWSHNLVGNRPTPLSSAYVIRTLQLLDDARVDLHAVGETILKRRNEYGTWSNRKALTSRPETTATILATLARMGMLTDVPGAVAQLRGGLDGYARSRPYVLQVMLESVLHIRPGHSLVEELVEALLAARTSFDDGLLWATNAATRADLAQPSLPHTARAVAVLRAVGSGDPAVEDAVTTAVDGMVNRTQDDDGTTETLDPAPDVPGAAIVLNHFAAPWCVRAFLGLDQVPAHRMAHSLDVIWKNFDGAEERLWCWRSDVTFPSWMTLDAVAALRAASFASFSTPLSP